MSDREEGLCEKQKVIANDLSDLWKDFVKIPVNKITKKNVEGFRNKIEFLYGNFKRNHNLITISQSSTEEYENQVVDAIVSLRDDFVEALDKALKRDQEQDDDDDDLDKDGDLNFNKLCANQFDLSDKMNELFKNFTSNSGNPTKIDLEKTREELEHLWGMFKTNHSNIQLLKQDTSVYETLLVDNMVTLHDDFKESLEKRLEEVEKIKTAEDDIQSLHSQADTVNYDSASREATPMLVVNPVSLSQMETSILEASSGANQSNSTFSQKTAPILIEPLQKFLQKNQSLCRICLETKANLAGIDLNHASGESVANLVESCTGLDVRMDPHLPQSICMECLKSLEDFYRFKRKTLESHKKIKEKFNEILKNLGKEVEIDEKIDNDEETSSDEETVADEEHLLVEIQKEQKREQPQRESRQPAKEPATDPPIVIKQEVESPRKSIECRICCEKFRFQDDILVHLSNVHKNRDGNLVCGECKFSTKQESEFYHHMRTHQGGKNGEHKCFECGNVLKNEVALRMHIFHKHRKQRRSINPAALQKQRSEQAVESPVAKSPEKSSITGKKSFYCSICKVTVESRVEAMKHLKTVHKAGQELFKCHQCKDFSSEGASAIYYHLQGHNDNFKKSCDRCGNSFYCQYSFWQHQNTACGRSAKQSDSRKRKRSETPNNDKSGNLKKTRESKEVFFKKTDEDGKTKKHRGPHYCLVCAKPFQTGNELNQHLEEKHMKSGSYNCKLCKDFQTVSAPRAQAHLKECKKRVICGICGKVSSTRSTFMSHLARHKHRISYKCQYCDKEILYNWGLRRHTESCHPGKKITKMIQVATAGKSSNSNSISKSPKGRNFSGKAGYKNYCYYCKKEESSVKNMILHLKKEHQKNGKYKCTACARVFHSARSAFYHITDHYK